MPPVPVRTYPTPAYPLRATVLADPDLLRRNLPPAWRRLAGAGGLVAFFLGAEALAAEPGSTAATAGAGPASAAATVVAPLFRHGEGRGAFGCVAVSPPVFLSEEEALAVIAEELSRRGVTLSQRDVAWDDVRVPRRQTVHTIPRGTPKDQEWSKAVITDKPVDPQPLTVDAIDPKRNIAVEFVAREDHRQLGLDRSHGQIIHEEDADLPEGTGRSGFFSSSAGGCDLAEASDYLRGHAARHRDNDRTTWMGVFYDPMETCPRRSTPPTDLDPAARQAWQVQDRHRRMEETRDKALTQLRAQVQDFIVWLQAQGAL